MSQLDLHQGHTHTIYLEPHQYLPSVSLKTDGPWSVALNILASFRLSDYMDGDVALFFEYQDLRGKHRLPIDFHQAAFENALLFSNLIHVPIRGNIEDVCLKVVGVTPGVELETELLHIQVEDSRSFVNSQSLRKVL
ncbi:hypothetical protein [Pleionea sediminis]|uniref:hypothetical protein n=1 Tax=Pleionea sediminis TaxID=2569479 RepID=UPI00118636F2|nr:hypothetical protein [Pleionea sediminis]